MIVSTLSALLIAAAVFAPGYVFLRKAEGRVQRRRHTALEEVASLIVVGVLCTGTGLAVVTTGLQCLGALDLEPLISRPGTYIAQHPLRMLWAPMAVTGLSYGAAWALAWGFYGGRSDAYVDAPVLDRALSRRRDDPVYHATTVQMRDGTRVTGQLISWTPAEVGDGREIELAAPLSFRSRHGDVGRLSDDLIVIPETEILLVSKRFIPYANPSDAE